MFLGNCRAGGSAPGWFGSSRSERGERASGRSPWGRVGTRLEWPGSRCRGGNLAAIASPARRRTIGPGPSGQGSGRFGWRRRFLRLPRSSCETSRKRTSRSSLSNNGTRRPISWRRSRPGIQTTRLPSPHTGTGFSTTTQSSQRRSCSKETWSGASRSSSTRNSASRRSPIGLERNIGEWPRDPSALKVPERHPSAPDLRPRGQGQCRLDPSHGKVWVHDIRVQQRIRERARQKDRGSHLGAEWTYGELRTDATAGYSSRQTRRPGRTPEPQFLVAPEEEGEPEGERQEPGGHRDRAKPI